MKKPNNKSTGNDALEIISQKHSSDPPLYRKRSSKKEDSLPKIPSKKSMLK